MCVIDIMLFFAVFALNCMSVLIFGKLHYSPFMQDLEFQARISHTASQP